MAIIHFRCKERRRTMRVMLSVPLRVHGITQDGETFAVETKSHTVSLHGASIELEQPVALGDILLLENELSNEQAEGKVVTIKRSRDGKVHVGIEFTDFDVNFWHMAFPVPGAKPLRRRLVPEKVSALS
ncbi:MAG: PilZ domain-containing protein [Candidatus Acidiferrum sp.]|jgi:PilZ domain-containing protein